MYTPRESDEFWSDSYRGHAIATLNRGNGWLADAYDTDQLGEGIAWLLDGPGRAERSAAARAKVLSGFSVKAEIDGYLDLYESLLAERRGGRATA